MSVKITTALAVLFTLITFITGSSIPKSDDVVDLTTSNFEEFIAGHNYTMLNFYASWCFWSHRLAPEYAVAATILKNCTCRGDQKVVVGRIDCNAESELCRKHKVQGYPTMALFVNGVVKFHYYGERTGEAIATWVKKKMAIDVSLPTLTTIEEAKHAVRVGTSVVFGFFDSLEGPENEELAAASKRHPDVHFYQTADFDIARLFHVDLKTGRPALVMWIGDADERTRINFDGEFTASAIADFVCSHKLHSITTDTEENLKNLVENPEKNIFKSPL